MSFTLHCPKQATIGNTIRDKKGMRTFPKKIIGTGRVKKQKSQKVLRKPKDIKALHSGNIVALDTVEIIIYGLLLQPPLPLMHQNRHKETAKAPWFMNLLLTFLSDSIIHRAGFCGACRNNLKGRIYYKSKLKLGV